MTRSLGVLSQRKLARSSSLIQGLGVCMISCVPPTIVLGVAIVGTATLGGSYGVAISAVGARAAAGLFIYWGRAERRGLRSTK